VGHKVHPIGLRLGIHQDWQSKWYADKHYPDLLQQDLIIRKTIEEAYRDVPISRIEIEGQPTEITVTIYTSRPGVIIGRGGQRVDEMRRHLEEMTGKKMRLNIAEVRQPELDATLVAKNIAEQIERRVSYRRAAKRAITQALQSGALGVKITVSGRLAGAEIARSVTFREGRVPLHTLRADIDYGFAEAHTIVGRIGVKVWIYKGDVVPE